MQLTRLGIIDLGSNSGRLILALRQVHGIPLVADEAQVMLRLAEGLQATGRIGRPAVERARTALLAFQAAAEDFGVERLITVGTSALRDATNGADVVEALQRATTLDIRVISGEQEAYYGYLAAVNSLPVRDGVVVDLGGGSLELSFVHNRACERAISVPLGALRLKERFLSGDPPTTGQVRALRAHIERELHEAGLRAAGALASLYGGGGTVRTLAKLARKAAGAPSMRLHGFTIEGAALDRLTSTLLRASLPHRRRIPGMPPERADIIAAGAVVVQTVMKTVGAGELVVSGQGLREGLAYEAFREAESPVIGDVRRAGVDAFRERYVTGTLSQFSRGDGAPAGDWPRDASTLPKGHPSDGVEELALSLFDQLGGLMEPVQRDRELLSAAAALCDAGRAVSLYRWPEHAVYLLTNGDLNGFTQQEAVVIGEAIASQEGQRIELQRYGVALPESDVLRAGQLGVIVGIARWLRRLGIDHGTPIALHASAHQISLDLPPMTPLIDDEWKEGLERGCRRYFGRELDMLS